MVADRTQHSREVPCWAGIDARGNIAWGTIRPDRAACAAIVERHNPSAAGHPAPLRVVPVFLGLDGGRQAEMEV